MSETPATQDQVVYQITTFKTSDAYEKDPTIFNPAIDIIVKNAPHGFSYGLQIEQPTRQLTAFTGWDSVQQNADFDETPDGKQLEQDIGPSVDPSSPPAVIHVSFEPQESALAALKAPLTEIITFTPKDGIAIADVTRAVAAATKVISKASHGAAWGTVVESPQEGYFIAGWDSLKAKHEIIHSIRPLIIAAFKSAKIKVGDRYAENWDDVAKFTTIHVPLKSVTASA